MKQVRLTGTVGPAGVLVLTLFAGLVTKVDAHPPAGTDPSVIHACVLKVAGITRIVGPNGACNARAETPLHWSIQGPPGVLGSFDDLAGLPCTKPGGGAGSVAVIYRGDGVATVACATERYLDLGFVVFDTQTGLMWEKKDQAGGLHDVDNTYDWCQATGNNAGSCTGNTASWIADVNAEKFFGYTDWRLPTGGGDGGELAGILLAPFPCGGTSPCIDPIFGPTASSDYWSATESDSGRAWFVGFGGGFVFNANKFGNNIYVRAVRGGGP